MCRSSSQPSAPMTGNGTRFKKEAGESSQSRTSGRGIEGYTGICGALREKLSATMGSNVTAPGRAKARFELPVLRVSPGRAWVGLAAACLGTNSLGLGTSKDKVTDMIGLKKSNVVLRGMIRLIGRHLEIDAERHTNRRLARRVLNDERSNSTFRMDRGGECSYMRSGFIGHGGIQILRMTNLTTSGCTLQAPSARRVEALVVSRNMTAPKLWVLQSVPMSVSGQKPPSPIMNELSAFSPKAVLVAGPNKTDNWAISL